MMQEMLSDMVIEPPVGASVWERELFEHLTSHIQRERLALQDYAEAAEATGSKAFAYVVGLLMEDERRHHELFMSLAASLKSEAELRSEDPEIPYLDFDRVNPDRVRELSVRLLNNELDDAGELKRLHRMMHDIRDTTLWDLLVKLMRRDTDKHIAMLRFVLQHIPMRDR